VPKEPRQRKVSSTGKSRDTVTRNIVIGMIALVVLSGVIFTVLDKRSGASVAVPASIESISSANNGDPVIPTISPEADYGVVFNADSPLRIDVWEDFQCPYCKFFEDAMGDYLETLIREKQAQVIYHIASFIGQESVRAANAASCAVPEGRFIEYHRALYHIQGGENSGLFSNRNLVEVGTRLGITSDSFASCVNDNQSGDVVKNVASSMKKNGVEGTPTVFINGKPWNRTTSEFRLEEFKAAVEAAKQ